MRAPRGLATRHLARSLPRSGLASRGNYSFKMSCLHERRGALRRGKSPLPPTLGFACKESGRTTVKGRVAVTTTECRRVLVFNPLQRRKLFVARQGGAGPLAGELPSPDEN